MIGSAISKTLQKTTVVRDVFKYARSCAPKSYSNDLRQKMDAMAREFNVNQIDDWYKLSSKVSFPVILLTERTMKINLDTSSFQTLTILHSNFFHLHTQNTNGYHGNSKRPPVTTGLT